MSRPRATFQAADRAVHVEGYEKTPIREVGL